MRQIQHGRDVRFVPILKAVLRQKAKPVETIDDELQLLIDDMIETMYAAPGIGLAAPQVGIPLRLFVVDVTSGQDVNALQTYINPEIISSEGRIREDEGCLSVVGVTGGHTACGARGAAWARPKMVIPLRRRRMACWRGRFNTSLIISMACCFFDRMGVVGRDLIKRKYKPGAAAPSVGPLTC